MDQETPPRAIDAGNAQTPNASPTAAAEEEGRVLPPSEGNQVARTPFEETVLLLIQTQAERAREQDEKIRKQDATIELLIAQLKKNPDDETKDTKEYLDVHETHLFGKHEGKKFLSVIEPGLSVHPEESDPVKSAHLYDISHDLTYAGLRSKSHDAAADEYWSLYCGTVYLSATIAAAKAEFFEGITLDAEASQTITRIFNQFDAVERTYRRRIGYIRLRTESRSKGVPDKPFEDYIRSDQYGYSSLPYTGSQEVDKVVKRYAAATQAATQKAAATAGAQRSRNDQSNGDGTRKPPFKKGGGGGNGNGGGKTGAKAGEAESK